MRNMTKVGGKSQVSSLPLQDGRWTIFEVSLPQGGEFQQPKFDFHYNPSFLVWKKGSPCMAFMVDSEWLNLAVLEVGKVS